MTKAPTAKELLELQNALPADAAPTGTEGPENVPLPSGDIVNENTPKQPNNPDAPPQVIGQTPGETPRVIFKDAEPKKGEKQVEIVLHADYWSDEGRQKVGAVVSVPYSKAKELMQAGKAHLPLGDA